MGYCLVLDTSTQICAAALYQNQNLISTICFHQAHVHSEKAAELIHELLKITKVSLQQMNYLAISQGPGSYTGLRIGFALIKSMAYALNIPIIGYSTLYGQIASYIPCAQQLQMPILSCLDAGRNEIYAAIYDDNGNLIQDLGPILLPHTDLESFLSTNSALIVGNGALKIRNYHHTSENTFFIPFIDNPTTGLGNYLQNQIQKQNFENSITFEPNYLKPVHITLSKKT